MKTQVSVIALLRWIFHFLPLLATGQEPFVTGAPPFFLWGAYNAGEKDAFCFSDNKAALARCRNACFGLSGERPYGLATLGRYRISVLSPLKKGSVGLQ